MALYAISIRQARDLPPPFFRFCLTADTLGLSYILPAAGRIRDFHPLERALTGRTRKKPVVQWTTGFWQRVKDSNPHIQSQSLLCYLYTNPLYSFARVTRTGIIILENKNLSRVFLKKIIFADFSHFQGIFPGKPPLRVHHQKQISLFRK